MSLNLIEAIQERCNFIRDTILPEYLAIGPAGAFGAIMLRQDIKKGEQAIASDNVVLMVQVLVELRETCERAL